MSDRVVLSLFLAFAGCEAKDGTLTVAAAMSLSDVLPPLCRAYEAKHPGVSIRTSFDGSQALARQVRAGAPVDLVIAADEVTLEGVVPTPRPLLSNRLVVVVPAGVPDAPDLATVPRLAIGGEAVPAGRYARAYLAARGIARDDLVLGDHVRAVLSMVARGDAGAGLVYATDAKTEPGVRIAFVAEGVTVRYAAGVPARAPNPEAARAFLDWLAGPEAAPAFVAAGFSP